jgi:hypothetical protein
MTGASKILTVSYGTFSCTLEGFDEPFNTMKAIAEYFRDLAADDRYFGAEPPTPDPAMLHQIAKREIQRRVDAKIEENGVVLRAGPAEEAGEVAAPAVPRLVDPAPAAESAAAKLSRIRAATAAPVVAPAVIAAEPVQSDYSEDEHATVLTGATTQTAPAFDEFDIDAFNDAILIDDGDLPEQAAEAEQAVALVDLANTDADLPEAQAVTAAEEDLGDLARLDAPEALDAQLEEDLIASTDQPVDEAEIAADDALLASLGALIGEGDQAAAAAEPAAAVAEVAQEDDWADAADLDDFDDTSAPEAVAAPEPAVADSIEALMAQETESQPEPAALAPARSEKLERARARVIRIRRADAPVAPAVAAEETPSDAAPAAAQAKAQSLLSDELEAALQAELAALEAETSPAPVQAVPQQAQPKPALPEAEPRKRLESEAQDDAVSRLIAQTNTEMQGPETRRRQSAIAHLKAAVAATVAERQINGSTGATAEETRAEAYRSDLDRAVRPRRPGEAASANADRPSPLVLVSEQRIDRPRPVAAPQSAAPAAPQIVRPRRVSPVQLAPQPVQSEAAATSPVPVNVFTETQPKSFAEFAEDRGANGLESLLEAAALYRAEVLHEPQFSRTDLFEAVTSLPATADVTLEDTLRSFGTLLRDGRIAKIRRGQFRLTGIADEDRAAG